MIPAPIPTQKNLTGESDTIIGNDHPRDGRHWECQCARCGSSLDWDSCDVCGGDGITGPGELYEEDPLWYDQDDFEPCHQCGGQASWPQCLSSAAWCEANPLKGREAITRNTPEWFVVEYRKAPSVGHGNEIQSALPLKPNPPPSAPSSAVMKETDKN